MSELITIFPLNLGVVYLAKTTDVKSVEIISGGVVSKIMFSTLEEICAVAGFESKKIVLPG